MKDIEVDCIFRLLLNENEAWQKVVHTFICMWEFQTLKLVKALSLINSIGIIDSGKKLTKKCILGYYIKNSFIAPHNKFILLIKTRDLSEANVVGFSSENESSVD